MEGFQAGKCRCQVCESDTTTTISQYGALVCESCRNFFKNRLVSFGSNRTVAGRLKCVTGKYECDCGAVLKACVRCRFAKCMRIGMSSLINRSMLEWLKHRWHSSDKEVESKANAKNVDATSSIKRIEKYAFAQVKISEEIYGVHVYEWRFRGFCVAICHKFSINSHRYFHKYQRNDSSEILKFFSKIFSRDLWRKNKNLFI
jgi:hypothetical protein